MIKITEKQLNNIIRESIEKYLDSEQLDESNLIGGLSGLGSMFKRKANTAGNKASEYAQNVKNKISGGIERSKNFAKKQTNDFKQAWNQGSDRKEMQNAIEQLQAWKEKGLFGKGRTVNSAITQLQNAIKLNFKSKYNNDI